MSHIPRNSLTFQSTDNTELFLCLDQYFIGVWIRVLEHIQAQEALFTEPNTADPSGRTRGPAARL